MNDNTAQKRPRAVPRPELAPNVPRPPLTQDLRQRSLRRAPAGSLLRVPRPAPIEDSDEAPLSEPAGLELSPDSLDALPPSELPEDEPMSGELSNSTSSIPMPAESTAMPAESTAMPAESTEMPIGSTAMPAESTAMPIGSTAMNLPRSESAAPETGAGEDARAGALDALAAPNPASLADVLADLDSERTAEFRVPEELLKQVRLKGDASAQRASAARSSGVQSKHDSDALEGLEQAFAQQHTAAYRVPAGAVERALALGVANDEYRRQVRDAGEKDTLTPIQRRDAVGGGEGAGVGAAEADGELSIPPMQPSPSQLAPPRLPMDLLEAPSGASDDDFSQELTVAVPVLDGEVAQAAFSSRFLLAVVGVLLVTVGVLIAMVFGGS